MTFICLTGMVIFVFTSMALIIFAEVARRQSDQE